MIIFEKVVLKNLFAFGNSPTEIPLNKAKTTLVIGKNGSGKSSAIIDSIHLALFNKPFRDVPKPLCINSVNNGAATVELYFTKGSNSYKILRGLKPNKFEIYENDILLNQEANARDYQEFLEETILDGLNEKVFKQVVMIGSANYIPFMQLTTAQRREVIEELLDIKIFSSINNLVKDKISWYKDILKELDKEIEIIEQKIKLQQENQKKIAADNDNKIAEYQTKIEQQQKEIHSITEKKTNIENKIKDIVVPDVSELIDQKTANSNILWKLQSNQAENTKTIEFFTNNCSCSTCLQAITEEHKKMILAPLVEKSTKFVEAITTVEEKINIIKQKIANSSVLQDEVRLHQQDIVKLSQMMTTANHLISDYKSTIEKLKKNTLLDDATNEIEAYTKNLSEVKTKRLKEIDDKNYYDLIALLLKDGGIKTKIINQYIPIINKTINEYLVRFGTPIEFTLDEQFNEVIKSRFRDAFKYNSFSEGEKQRIDMALLLTWREIAKSKNTTNTNLLIFDETFDSSLDNEATDELLGILKAMDKNTNIFIISHKADMSERVSNVIEFVKVGNFSQIKD